MVPNTVRYSMTKLLAALLISLGLASAALAQSGNPTPGATNFINIPGTVAGATKIISGKTGQSIYVTSLLLVPVATSIVHFTVGTGTNCATNTADIISTLTFTNGGILTYGIGNGVVMIVPQGFDLCLAIATAVAPGGLTYTQY